MTMYGDPDEFFASFATIEGYPPFAFSDGGTYLNEGAHRGSGESQTRTKRLHTFTSTNTVMETEFAPIRWAIEGFVPEGFSVMAGRQKLGKSRLALDFALAVATGGVAMSCVPCEQGDVLYVDLENGDRRNQRRIGELFPDERSRPDLSRLSWSPFRVPHLGDGFLDMLEQWRGQVERPRLVIIDVLQRVKPAGHKARNAYENDYAIFAELQTWATEHGIAIVGLTHTKKGGADDPLEAVTGSNGLSAVADTTLILDSAAGHVTLYVRGRDVEEREAALKLVECRWNLLGDAADVNRSGERKRILDVLKEADQPLGPKAIAAEADLKEGNVRFLLTKMKRAGEVESPAYGRYQLPGAANTANTANTSSEGAEILPFRKRESVSGSDDPANGGDEC